MGPAGFQAGRHLPAHRRLASSRDGWAHFDYVKMPDYRWGIFLEPHEPGPHASASATTSASPCGSEVPGEHRNMLRRLIVTQGDTEPA